MTEVARLLVDVRPVDHPTARERGIGRYTLGLLGGLTRIGAPVTGLYGSDVEAREVRAVVPDAPLARWSPEVVREAVTASGTDRSWYLATQLMLHPVPLDPIPSVVTESGLPVAAVMYDVIPYRHPDVYLRDPNARAQAQLRAPLARTTDALLAISQFSAETAAEELGYPSDRIATIGAGVEERFVPPSTTRHDRPDRVLPASVDRYVVAVTGGDERKNTEGLLRAWARLPEDLRAQYHLVVATAAAAVVIDRWRATADEVGLGDGVVFTGRVTDEEMIAVLQHAELSVMPSFEEGFGLPVLEAAACGTLAICSDGSSLPEVLDEPGGRFDPRDPDAIADAVNRALTDDEHRARLRAAGERSVERYTWERSARDTLAALRDLGPRWRRPLRPPPPRIALAGPFEGSGSGIGRYDVRLVEALSSQPRAPSVERLVDGSGSSEPAVRHGRPVRGVGRFVKPWSYDHIVAVLGSSHHHVATAELAASTPCHVWLHEASLVGVYLGLGHRSGSEEWARTHVAAHLGADDRRRLTEAGLGEVDDVLLDAERLDAVGVSMIHGVVGAARSIVVSSDRAAEIVRRAAPAGPPVLVLPLAHPPVLERDGPPPANRELLAVGWLGSNKAPDVAVEVLRRLADTTDGVRLTFAGAVDPAAADEVRRAARAAGVADRIELTGWLDDVAYADRVRRARVGLQLRDGERGEMSAAVADLLAAGVPTVTTLTTAGPDSPGVRVVPLDAARIADEVRPLLVDDTRWADASDDAATRAGTWTFDDVAAALLAWLEEVDTLDPGTVRRLR